MKNRYLALVVMAVVVLFGSRLQAAEADVAKDIEMLKQKIVELEQKLQEQKIAQQKYARKVAEEVHEEIEESLEERFGTLEIHGGAILYYQDSRTDELNGENSDSPSDAGFTADIELTWKPPCRCRRRGVLCAYSRRQRYRSRPHRRRGHQAGRRAAGQLEHDRRRQL